jgi:hypothetical protein
LAIGAGIDLGRRYKDQSITKLAKLMVAVSTRAKCKRMPPTNVKQAREAEPYLAKFEDDWATGQILRQYISGKQKYENAKAKGTVKVGGKRKRSSSTSPALELLPNPNGEIERESLYGGSDYDGHGEDHEDGNEWGGFGNGREVFGGRDGDSIECDG